MEFQHLFFFHFITYSWGSALILYTVSELQLREFISENMNTYANILMCKFNLACIFLKVFMRKSLRAKKELLGPTMNTSCGMFQLYLPEL